MADIKEEDLTLENIGQFIQNVRKALMLDFVDPSFYAGITQILEHANSKVQGVETQRPDEDIPEVGSNKTIDLIEEFYSKLSPELADMFHNSSRIAHYDLSSPVKGGNHENIVIDGTYKSIIEGAHEFAHRLTMGDSKADYNQPRRDEFLGYVIYPEWSEDFTSKAISDADFILDELDPTYAELLCTDFLEQKYNKKLDGLLSIRMEELKEMSQPQRGRSIASLSYFKLMSQYVQFITQTPLSEETLPKHQSILKELNARVAGSERSSIMDKNYFGEPCGISRFKALHSLSHEIDFLLANYIHKNVNMDNPQQATSIFKTMVDINGLSSDYTQEQIQMLSTIGLPFIMSQNGKMGMSQNGVDQINRAFDNTLENFQERAVGDSSKAIEEQDFQTIEQPNMKTEQTISTSGKDKIKEQLLKTLNEPPSLEEREEARKELVPQQTISLESDNLEK